MAKLSPSLKAHNYEIILVVNPIDLKNPLNQISLVVSDDTSTPSLPWIPKRCTIYIKLVPPHQCLGPSDRDSNLRGYLLGFAHTIEKFQGLVKTDFMEIVVGDGVLKNNLISILPKEPNGKKEKGVPRVGGLMPNNDQAIGLQPILYISNNRSNEGRGGPPISSRIYKPLHNL